MITILKGDLARIRDREEAMIKEWLVAHPDGEVTRRDSDEIDADELAQMLLGGGLFVKEQLLALRLTSEVSAVASILLEAEADIIISAIDGKATTALLSALKDSAAVIDLSKSPSHRDRRARLEAYCRQHQITIQPQALSVMLEPADASLPALERELDKLSLLGRAITAEDCRLYGVLGQQSTIFSLFDVAAAGQKDQALQQLEHLKSSEAAYQCFAVLTGTIASLAAVAAGDSQGVHPFVASKLQAVTKRRGQQWVEACLAAAMKAEHMMKRSRADEWQTIAWLITQIA